MQDTAGRRPEMAKTTIITRNSQIWPNVAELASKQHYFWPVLPVLAVWHVPYGKMVTGVPVSGSTKRGYLPLKIVSGNYV